MQAICTLSFRKFEEVENITLFHYSNMVDDLRKAIRSIAATLGSDALEKYASRVREIVPEEDVLWLEGGGER